MRIEVDRGKCDGLGMCEAMAPDFFEVADEGAVRLLDEHPDEQDRELVTAAVDSCPMLALRLRD